MLDRIVVPLRTPVTALQSHKAQAISGEGIILQAARVARMHPQGEKGILPVSPRFQSRVAQVTAPAGPEHRLQQDLAGVVEQRETDSRRAWVAEGGIIDFKEQTSRPLLPPAEFPDVPGSE